MDTVTLKINESILKKMEEEYKNIINYKNENYILWQCDLNLCHITIYFSKKGLKALFSGENCLKEASKWDCNCSINEKKEKIKTYWLNLEDQIGSDEVGTGDFFGPIVVVASFIKKEDIPFFRSLNIDDSKKINDQKILEIVPQILDKVIFSKLTCSNDKYNELINKGYSMNSIKALLHNKALINVRNKINDQNMECYIDQFCSIDSYYRYLMYEKEVIRSHITFHTKGESYYPSIALSSMIARYCFLKEIEVLNLKYKITIPKGASNKVDEFAKEFINKYGINELTHIVKTNFVNFKNLLNK